MKLCRYMECFHPVWRYCYVHYDQRAFDGTACSNHSVPSVQSCFSSLSLWNYRYTDTFNMCLLVTTPWAANASAKLLHNHTSSPLRIYLVSLSMITRHLRSAGEDLIMPADQYCRLRSTKLSNRWSFSVEQSAVGNEDDFTDTWTVLDPAENWNVLM